MPAFDPDNLNTETRLPHLIALWLESRRTAMDWPASTVLPITPNSWSGDLANPALTINCKGGNVTHIMGQLDLEILIDLRNTTNENGITFANETLYVSRLRRELARRPADSLSFMGWAAAQATGYRNYLRLHHFRIAGITINFGEDDHTRIRQTRMTCLVSSDEVTAPA